jgi:putative endonuclease
MSNQSFGRIGERAAEKYLRGLGYEILARNFRTRFGEIDLVARDGGCLVFAEVKTRADGAYGAPEEAVTKAKQKHLIAAAQIYLSQTKQPHALWRADVLALTQKENGGFDIRHLVNAVIG